MTSERGASTAELVEVITDGGQESSDATLRQFGMCLRPTLHMIDEAASPPYLGYVRCREFYRGEDAERAVTAMGLLAATVEATRLVVLWDYADLCTALELPGESFPSGLVAVDASPAGHTVRWRPYEIRWGPELSPGWPTVLPEWGPEVRHPGGWLPDPVAALLRIWREQPGDPAGGSAVAAAMEDAGYHSRWVVRD